jgi:hypothetical protein
MEVVQMRKSTAILTRLAAKGYFAVLHPLTPGTHHARIDATYPAFDFEGLTDYTITVR